MGTALYDPYTIDTALSDPYTMGRALSDPYTIDTALSDPYTIDTALSDPYTKDTAMAEPYTIDTDCRALHDRHSTVEPYTIDTALSNPTPWSQHKPGQRQQGAQHFSSSLLLGIKKKGEKGEKKGGSRQPDFYAVAPTPTPLATSCT